MPSRAAKRKQGESDDAADKCIRDPDVGGRRRAGNPRASQRDSGIACSAEATAAASSTRRSGAGGVAPRASSSRKAEEAATDAASDDDNDDDGAHSGSLPKDVATELRKQCARLRAALAGGGGTALPTSDESAAALRDVQQALGRMRDLTAQLEAMHALYDVPGDRTYVAIADAVIKNLQERFDPGVRVRILDMGAGKGTASDELAERNSDLPVPFKLELIKADVAPDPKHGVVGVDDRNRPVVGGELGQFDAVIARGCFYSRPVTHGMVVAMVEVLREGGLAVLVPQKHMLHYVAPTVYGAMAAGVLTDVTIAPAAQQEGGTPAYLLLEATRGSRPVDEILTGPRLLRQLCLGDGSPTPLGQACLEALSMMKCKLELDDAISGNVRPLHRSFNFGICVTAAGALAC